jgi:hypothetical protein
MRRTRAISAAPRASIRSIAARTAIGRAASGAPVGSVAPRTTVRTIASRASSIGPIFRCSGPLSILAIPFTAHDHSPALDHLAVHARDNTGGISFRDFDESVALLQVDLSDAISGNSAFAGDDPHDISDLHAVAGADRHEEARHSRRRTSAGSRSLAFSGARFCRRVWIRLDRAPLRPLALQQEKCGCSELSSVEFPEQRLERDYLAGGKSAREHGA